MLCSKGIDVSHTLLLQDFIHSNEDTRLLHISESVVDGRTEELHGGAQSHVGIHQGWDVVAQVAHLAVQDTVVGTELILHEDIPEYLWVMLQLKRNDGTDEIVGIGEMLVEEIQYHVSAHTVETGIHGKLAKEVAHCGFYHHQGTQSVPQVVQGKDALSSLECTLIFQCHEGAPQLDGPGSILTHETVAEAEHMTGGQDGLPVLAYLPVLTQQIAVSAQYLLCLGIPHEELAVRLLHGVILIDVHTLARTTSCCTEGNLAQAPYLAHHVG